MYQAVTVILGLAFLASVAAGVVHTQSQTTMPVIEDTHSLVQSGVQMLEHAFVRRARELGGMEPEGRDVDLSRLDGGLEPKFEAYAEFLPRPPSGYAWTYGFTTQEQLIADGYRGDAQGGRYWFCLYPANVGGTQRERATGFVFAKVELKRSQLYVNSGGSRSCGRAINSRPITQPNEPVVATLFVEGPFKAPAVQTHFALAEASMGPGNGKWTVTVRACAIGTNGAPLTGLSAGLEVKVIEEVATWDGKPIERSYTTRGDLDGEGCVSFQRKNMRLPTSGKESVEAVRFEVTVVDYYWPKNPDVPWDGIQPIARVTPPGASA